MCGQYLAVQVQQAQLGMLDDLAFLVVDANAVRLPGRAEPRADLAEIGDQLGEAAVGRVPAEARPEIGDECFVVLGLFLIRTEDPHRQASEVAPDEVVFGLGAVQGITYDGGPHLVPGDQVPAHVLHSSGTC